MNFEMHTTANILLRQALLEAEAFALLAQHEELAQLAVFHAQQSVEKAFQSVLSRKGASYPVTHDLIVLWDALLKEEVTPPLDRDHVIALIPFAVEGRYKLLVTSLDNPTIEKTLNDCLAWVKQVFE